MNRLAGRVALITGGAKGIGAEIARVFTREGARVVINYHTSKDEAEELAERLPGATAIQADVSDARQVRKLILAAVGKHGRLDILVNNASYSAPDSYDLDIEHIDEDEWRKVVDVDLTGTFLVSKYATASLRKCKGAIINIASAASLQGDSTVLMYSASKAGVLGFTRCLAHALAPDVRVNGIAPGSVATEWIEKWKVPQSALRSIVRSTPLKRLGWPEDVALAALFLASPEASFVTGQTLVVDGGNYMS